jgi:hypothetical protein
MKVKDEHKHLLKEIGLKEEDFPLFDGKNVDYEFNDEKGVRIYDPDYTTSYNEYIDVDGWSAWSVEKDTFMKDILKGVPEKIEKIEASSPPPQEKEMEKELHKKFNKQ